MNHELLEKGVEVQDKPQENNYQGYLDLGGIINEKDYDEALKKARSMASIERALISQAENIAKFAGIELHGTGDSPDPRVILYGVLRTDVRPEGVKHHHDGMTDQAIFMEALRMLGDAESVDKMIKKHPHISFKYERGDE